MTFKPKFEFGFLKSSGIDLSKIQQQADFKEPFFDVTCENENIIYINKDRVYKLERLDGKEMNPLDYQAIDEMIENARQNRTDSTEA